jgi:hypothetical protein
LLWPNLLNFRRRVASTTDEAERKLLRMLLFEAECKERKPKGWKPDDRQSPTMGDRHEP